MANRMFLPGNKITFIKCVMNPEGIKKTWRFLNEKGYCVSGTSFCLYG